MSPRPPVIVRCDTCHVEMSWSLGDVFVCLICGARVVVELDRTAWRAIYNDVG